MCMKNNVEYVMNSSDSRMMFYCQASVDKHPSRRSGLWTKWIIQFCTFSHFKMLRELCYVSIYSGLHLSKFLLLSEKVLFWKRCVSRKQMLLSFDGPPRTVCTFAYTVALDETILNLQRGIIFWFTNIIQSLTRFSLIQHCEITLTL